MADMVYNHCGYCAGGSLDYSCLVTFNTSEAFHTYCEIQDWNSQTQLYNCRLSDLPDLN